MIKYHYKLTPIDGVDEDESCLFKIRALTIIRADKSGVSSKSPTLAELSNLNEKDYQNYLKLMKSLNKAARLGTKCPKDYFQRDKRGRSIYEIKTKTGIRLFCFFNMEGNTLICFNMHKKSRGGNKVQDRAFDTCFIMKKIYYRNVYGKDV